MTDLRKLEVWFVTGSQHLYGNETLATVAENARSIARGLGEAEAIPVRVVAKPVMTGPDAIRDLCREANSAANCIGLVCWMHTFSPAKMWIAGLRALAKPFAHLHTQFNRELPWASIDMDFMNLNQSAHGDREFGFIGARMRLNRKVIVGFWQDREVIDRLASWTRAAAAWHDAESLKIARFGDNMREVAVTEGDKVTAQIQLQYSVNGYGLSDLLAKVKAVGDADVDRIAGEYRSAYRVTGPVGSESLREAARIEAGLRAFLEEGGFGAFTDTFENLDDLVQLPGIAVQRLMADGYGFGAEGDWKTAALVRAMKVMAQGLPGGSSFMEDYTYHFGPDAKVLGAHMLEVCPTIASDQPTLEVHPLGIGGKADPARLVFTAAAGPAINATLIDLGDRFRMIVNEVDVVEPEADLPKLPVARALWKPRPNLPVGAAAWIYAGGAHHTGFSQALTAEHIEDFAAMAGVELVVIDAKTDIRQFRNELRWNEAAYALGKR